jgi:hemerythrin-like domain-containing protein
MRMAHPSMTIIRDEHASLSAMLRSMLMMTERGPDGDDPAFFDVLRAMLFYIDEFPERQHHPKESNLLFPRVAAKSAELFEVVARLEKDHLGGEAAVRELQHLLLAWELLGEPRRARFAEAARGYVEFYLTHMRLEETVILPQAEKLLTPKDWDELDRAFAENHDPLTDPQAPMAQDPAYARLFTRIVMRAPAPIGLGPSS